MALAYCYFKSLPLLIQYCGKEEFTTAFKPGRDDDATGVLLGALSFKDRIDHLNKPFVARFS